VFGMSDLGARDDERKKERVKKMMI